jgi:DNA-bindng response regulator, araC family
MYKAVIVDDEEDIRYLIKYMIEKSDKDFEVVGEATDGESGIELCKELVPDVVFADIRMPVMGGLEMIGKLKDILPSVQTIIISGYGYFSYAQEAMRQGAVGYLLKPLDEELLNEELKKVKNTLKKSYKEKTNKRRMENEIKKFKNSWKQKDNESLDIDIENEQIKKALFYIHENYSTDITLEDTAGAVFMNSSYFSALFKKELGQSFISYVNKLRMEKAIKLLDEERFKVVEIAHILGFRDVSYFNRVFKKYYGYVPSKHQKNKKR